MKEVKLKTIDLAHFLKWVSMTTIKRDGKYFFHQLDIFMNEVELAEYFIQVKIDYDNYFKKLKKKKNETTTN